MDVTYRPIYNTKGRANPTEREAQSISLELIPRDDEIHYRLEDIDCSRLKFE